jgi:hypothetical protein
MERGDGSFKGRRYLDDGLGGFHFCDGLVDVDGVALGNQPGDEFGLDEPFAEVRQHEDLQAHDSSH